MGAHDGKHFIIQKGVAQCNQGIAFPHFKVTSQKRHFINSEEADDDYLIVTENDVQFDPPSQPFGAQCKLQPTSNGYKPCSFAAAGKWQKTYEKISVEGQHPLTEISELQCTIGGLITVMKHGQQSEVSREQVLQADTDEQEIYNPVVDFDAYKDDISSGDSELDVW